jgi:hypothetical protein
MKDQLQLQRVDKKTQEVFRARNACDIVGILVRFAVTIFYWIKK